jgi:gas vesicle protein
MGHFKNLLLAGLFGYILGLLFAPKKGSELRDDLRDLVLDLKDVSAGTVSQVKSKSQELIDIAQPTLNQVKAEASNLKTKAATSFTEALSRATAKGEV